MHVKMKNEKPNHRRFLLIYFWIGSFPNGITAQSTDRWKTSSWHVYNTSLRKSLLGSLFSMPELLCSIIFITFKKNRRLNPKKKMNKREQVMAGKQEDLKMLFEKEEWWEWEHLMVSDSIIKESKLWWLPWAGLQHYEDLIVRNCVSNIQVVDINHNFSQIICQDQQ